MIKGPQSLRNTVLHLMKIETVRLVIKFLFLIIMFLSNLSITSRIHVLPQKHRLALFAAEFGHLFFLRTNASLERMQF